MTAGAFVMGVAAYLYLKERYAADRPLYRKAIRVGAAVTLVAGVGVAVTGDLQGKIMTEVQPMKMAAAEALYATGESCAPFSLFTVGTLDGSEEVFSVTIPCLLSFLGTGSFDGEVQGLNQLQAQEESKYGPGNYMPNVRVIYWSMRVMAYLGVLMFLVAAVGAWLYRRRKLEHARWFQRTAIVAIAFPYLAATAGWVLTEMGRQPWIVQDLLRTEDAHSPSVSAATIAFSLVVFYALYIVLGIVDFVLMRRYARPKPSELGEEGGEAGVPAVGY